MKRVINLFLVLALTANAGICMAVKTSRVDSLSTILNKKLYNSEAEHLRLLSEYGNICMESDLPKSLNIASEQLRYAQEYKSPEYIAEAYERMGRILYMQGKNDSAMIRLNQAIEIYSLDPSLEHKKIVARNFLANVYRVIANYDKAMEIYNESLQYYESLEDYIWIAKILANIGSLYYTAGNQEKGEEFTIKALELQRKTGDVQGEVISLVNLTVFAINNNQFEQGISFGEEALLKLKPINITYYASALIRVGYCHYMLGNTKTAIEYTNNAIEIYKTNNSVVGMMEGYRTLADYYMDMKMYNEAKRIGLEALQQADSTNRLDIRLLYDLLKRASIFLNQHDDALLYSSKQIKLKEEDTNRDWAEKITEIEARYQTEKKDIEISRLHATKKSQNILLISLAIIIILGSLGTTLVLINIKQKRVLADQKMRQLESENQLIAAHALLEGETSERTRLSKDLHDGLGGLLSVTKHKIANMKGSLTIPEEQVETFNSALEMLDKSIIELRRVAHNLMPESLVKYGLNSALKDFCANVEKVQYHFFGVEKRLDDKLEVTAFRIACELINNALKHAEASTINAQLVQEEGRICLTVYDNGCGFNYKSLDLEKTNGLQNIKSRVVSYNGLLDIISEPGKGTEISVEFNY